MYIHIPTELNSCIIHITPPPTILNLLGVVEDGVGGGSRRNMTGYGGHHGLVHLRPVIAAQEEHDVGTHKL